MKLYEITRQLQEAWVQTEALIDAPEVDDAQRDALLSVLENDLKQIEGDQASKAVNVALLVKNIEADAVALAAEEKKLKDRRQRAERNAEWLRTYLAGNLEAGKKIADPRVVISWRKSTSVEVEVKPEELPTAYQRTKVTVEADRVAIKEALQAGTEVVGARLVEKQNIQIK